MEHDSLRSYSLQHTRVWALLLLRALNKAGLTPCSNSLFHRAAYFANVLAQVYDFHPPSEVVMRHPRGPFYPHIQSDLDWLCLVRFGNINGVRYIKEGGVTVRIGNYDITEHGFSATLDYIKDLAWVKEASQFLDDLAHAMSITRDEFVDVAEQEDFTYNSASSQDRPVINFRDRLQNWSLEASEEIRRRVPEQLRPIPQRTLRLYLKYLDQAAA